MQEVTVFDNSLGLMLFDNDWQTISIKSKDINDKKASFSLVYGGGTNSISINLQKITNISFDDFKKTEIDSDFNKERFSQYQTFELPREGILKRSGADYIYLGIGNGKDSTFKEINNYSSIIYFYSTTNKTGYIIDHYMNISKNNNNYDIQESIFNHLVFQSLLSFVNN
jgi:hypothetical protein